MTWLNLGSLGGLIALACLAWAAGGFRRPVPWRTVLTAGGLMLVLGAVVFWIPWTRIALIWVNDTVITVLRAGNEGARFLFGPLALNPGEAAPGGAPSVDALAGPVDLRRILGWLFTPLAWLLGLAGSDLTAAGRILGGRAILTEVVAYQELGRLGAEGAISPRAILILSYALCGFAHVASVGVFIGGIGALAPARRGDLSSLGIRALVGATLATLMTGALAGFYYYGQTGLLGI